MMMKKYIKFFLIGFLLSCESRSIPEKKEPELEVSQYQLKPVFLSLLDEFSKEMSHYKSKNVNLIGYIRINKVSEGECKVTLLGITSDELSKQFEVNDFFVRNEIYWCIDLDMTDVFSSTNNWKNELVEKSRIREYKKADTRLPAWLILIKKDSIVKQNKYAQSPFYKKKSLAEVVNGKTVIYNLSEWGDVINENGDTIGKYNGTGNIEYR